MERLTAPMEAHHKTCDEAFAGLEEAVAKKDWVDADARFARFSHALLAHFGVEEDSLFPAFERCTGMAGGPTRIMRLEHMQMRALVEELAEALKGRDDDEFLGVVQTLLVLMQQHNMKEENILYPMCDDAMGDESGNLRALIAAAVAPGAPA